MDIGDEDELLIGQYSISTRRPVPHSYDKRIQSNVANS